MITFDWKRFCKDNRISFVESGPNTAKGNISIQCPWCGAADKSQHMGLSLVLNDPKYGCWRSSMHRGKNPAMLISKIMGWPMSQAITYVETQQGNPDDFELAIAAMSAPKETQARRAPTGSLIMPTEFREFTKEKEVWNPTKPLGVELRFLNYLIRDRGFSTPESLFALIHKYHLRWCISGDYQFRIVIPVYHNGLLVSWTARALGNAVIRYKSLEDEKSPRNIKDCLLLHSTSLDNAKDKALVLCEGPFDAMKIDVFGSKFGVSATCMFGLTLSDSQLATLSRIGKLFKKVVIMLDSTTGAEGDILFSQVEELMGRGVEVAKLSPNVKDPGELTGFQVRSIVKRLTAI